MTPANSERASISCTTMWSRSQTRHALTALLRELEGQLASTRDLSERATSQRSPKALTQVRQQLISTGLDSQIVAADIARLRTRRKVVAARRPRFHQSNTFVANRLP